jgi:hypothetical protein
MAAGSEFRPPPDAETDQTGRGSQEGFYYRLKGLSFGAYRALVLRTEPLRVSALPGFDHGERKKEMRDERTKVEKLAFTLDYLVTKGIVPGLLPRDVTEAAQTLRDQEAELKTLRTALAAKNHVVEAEVTGGPYQKLIRATFIVADPRIYYGEVRIDEYLASKNPDYVEFVSGQLAGVGTRDWLRDLKERAYVAVRNAIAIEAATADETAETGSARSAKARA